MSVQTIEEEKTRQASFSFDDNEATYTRTWVITTNDPQDGPKTVYEAWQTDTGISLGSTYDTTNEDDTGSYAKDINVQDISDDGRVWRLTVSYGALDSTSQNPTERTPEYSGSFQQFERQIDTDIYDNKITNSAGEGVEGSSHRVFHD